MKYNAPYGVSDPNAPYINGNPSTGAMGSIPPAASIEFPQREIVHFIEDSRLVPDNGDLHQLAKAVQSGQVIYGDDGGVANQVVLTVSPPVTQLVKGMIFVSKIKTANTGESTLQINALAPVAIIHAKDFLPLVAGELVIGSMQAFCYDGLNFQLVWSQGGSSTGSSGGGGVVSLTTPRTFYVNGTTGSDTNDGTAATVGGGHGPFKTIQKACDQIPLYNLNGYSIAIYVADGSYAGASMPAVNGSGSISLTGNLSNPPACVVTGVNMSGFFIQSLCGTSVGGFQVQSTGAFPGGGFDAVDGLAGYGTGTYLVIGPMYFGSCVSAQLRLRGGASACGAYLGVWFIVVGTAQYFLVVENRSSFEHNENGGPNFQINPYANYYAFILVQLSSWANFIYNGGVGFANASGYKYIVRTNSVIGTRNGGPNYYPGSLAGVADTSSGGYYQ